MAFSEINRYMSQRCFYLCLEFYDSHICCNTHRGMLCLVKCHFILFQCYTVWQNGWGRSIYRTKVFEGNDSDFKASYCGMLIVIVSES